jgi:hypothetical protein
MIAVLPSKLKSPPGGDPGDPNAVGFRHVHRDAEPLILRF